MNRNEKYRHSFNVYLTYPNVSEPNTIWLKNGPDWTMFWWSALFLSLGWNFIEFSIYPPDGSGIAWGWIICAVLFGLMGFAPLLLIGSGGLPHPLFGREKEGIKAPESGLESRNFLLVLHFGSVLVGFFLAQFLLQSLS